MYLIQFKSNFFPNKAFRKLLNNYESDTDRPEKLTEHEERENWYFLDQILETPLMQVSILLIVIKVESTCTCKILNHDILCFGVCVFVLMLVCNIILSENCH